MIEEPDMDKSVFVKVVKTIPESIRAGQDRITLTAGNIYVIRYTAIARQIELGNAQMI
jgi:GINS complex subunit 4